MHYEKMSLVARSTVELGTVKPAATAGKLVLQQIAASPLCNQQLLVLEHHRCARVSEQKRDWRPHHQQATELGHVLDPLFMQTTHNLLLKILLQETVLQIHRKQKFVQHHPPRTRRLNLVLLLVEFPMLEAVPLPALSNMSQVLVLEGGQTQVQICFLIEFKQVYRWTMFRQQFRMVQQILVGKVTFLLAI